MYPFHQTLFSHARKPVQHPLGRVDKRVLAATAVLTVTSLLAALVSVYLVDPASATEPRHGRSDPPAVADAHTITRARPHTPTARRDATQTVRAARQSDRNAPGYCLRWARSRAGVPAKYLSADVAWRHAHGKHRRDRTPPAGAAVYWTGGSHGYGHVAISVGHGKVRSTDAGGEGHVATVDLGWPHRVWGLRYAGWSDSINGYTIPGVAADRR